MPSPRVSLRPALVLAASACAAATLAACGGPASTPVPSGTMTAAPTKSAAPATPTDDLPSGPGKPPLASGSVRFTITGATNQQGIWPLVNLAAVGDKDGCSASGARPGMLEFAFVDPSSTISDVDIVVPSAPGTYQGSSDASSKVHLTTNFGGMTIYATAPNSNTVTLNADQRSGSFTSTGLWGKAGQAAAPPGALSAKVTATWTCTPS